MGIHTQPANTAGFQVDPWLWMWTELQKIHTQPANTAGFQVDQLVIGEREREGCLSRQCTYWWNCSCTRHTSATSSLWKVWCQIFSTPSTIATANANNVQQPWRTGDETRWTLINTTDHNKCAKQMHVNFTKHVCANKNRNDWSTHATTIFATQEIQKSQQIRKTRAAQQ